nr:reverse transcriptase domain-containing protein [Tanacetum cinerariifolium]
NRRRSKQIVKPELRTIVETPVATMADKRTMSELLQAPTEGYGDAIVLPSILAKIFERKARLLQLVTSSQFHGFERDDPHAHIRWFNKIASTLKYQNVSNKTIMLMFFPFSLDGAARIWLKKEPPRSILTWEDLQRFDESFGEAWDRFEDLLRKCPHYGFSELHQIDTFYNALTQSDQDSLNAAAGGNLLNCTPRDALMIIENKSKVHISRNKPIVSKVSTTTSSLSSSPDVTALTKIIKELVLMNKATQQATVKAIEETCVTCGGPHPYYECLATGGNTFDACTAMPKFASTFKSLLSNKEKLFELASTSLNENCSAVLLKKLPEKLREPDKFLIPCDFPELEECLALADLGANINLMPLFVWKKLLLPELTPTRMTLELANRSIAYPVGVAEDVFVKVEKFYFSADFVVVDYDVDPQVPLILERPFFRMTQALIDVYGEDLTLRVNDEAIMFKVGHTLRYSRNHYEESVYQINVIDVACEKYAQEILKFTDSSTSGNPTLSDPIIASSSPSFTPFEGSDFILEEIETFLRTLDDLSNLDDDYYDTEGDILYLEKLLNEDPSPNLPLMKNEDLKQVDEKTTFTCPYGTFAYRRMPFGLCNAPGTFQKCMMSIFHDMIEKTMELFMDDFSVFGGSFSSCLTNLDKMLNRCEETNLVLNWEKCHFMCKEGIVLGHKISKSGIEVDRAKVDVIAKLSHPTTITGVRSFLGHVGFYRRFIQDFSKIARQMTHLLEKETPFVFTKECIEAFNTLKKKLTEASILVVPDWNLPFELMSIVYTDQSVLKYLLNKQDAKPRFLRWVLLLQEFDITILDKKGSENLAADHLSRLENPHQDVLENKDINENFPLETLGSLTSHSTPWKLLKFSKLATRDLLEAIMVPISQRRRRSKQIVKPELRTIVETPVATMADTRTRSELLQAPTEGYGEAIVLPPILAENFERKARLLQLVTSSQFHGFERDDPHARTRWFNKIASTLKYQNVSNEAIMLMFFPFSLDVAARIWLEKEPPQIIKELVLMNKATQQATVKAIEETCVTCGGPHPYYECLATGGNTFDACAAVGTYNQGGNRYRPQRDPNNRASNQIGPPGFPPPNVQNTDFVVVDYDVDPRVPLILERPFFRMTQALIDVYGEELTLRVNDEAIMFKVEHTLRYSRNHYEESVYQINVIDVACEKYAQEVLKFTDSSTSRNPTLSDPIIASSSPSFTPFEGSDFILEEIETFLRTLDDLSNLDDDYYDTEGDILYLEKLLNEDPSPNFPLIKNEDLKKVDVTMTKPSIEEPPELELKDLPTHLEYAFLERTDKLPILIYKELKDE